MSEPTSATALSRTPGAICARRYRARRKDGIFCARIRISPAVVKFLVDGGFLTAGSCQNADIERAIYGLLNAAHRARIRNA